MASNVVDNFFYHIIKSPEKGSTIACGLDENIQNELLIKSIVPICGPGFDLVLMEGLKRDYDASQYCFLHSLLEKENLMHLPLKDILLKLYNEYKKPKPRPKYLIIDSIDLILMQTDKRILIDFIQFFAVRYIKVIYFYTHKLVSPLFAEVLHNLGGSLFYFCKTNIMDNIIKVNYKHLRTSTRVMNELILDKYSFYLDPCNFANYLVPYNETDEENLPDTFLKNFNTQLQINTDVDARRLPDHQQTKPGRDLFFDYLPDKYDDVDEDDPDEDLLI